MGGRDPFIRTPITVTAALALEQCHFVHCTLIVSSSFHQPLLRFCLRKYGSSVMDFHLRWTEEEASEGTGLCIIFPDSISEFIIQSPCTRFMYNNIIESSFCATPSCLKIMFLDGTVFSIHSTVQWCVGRSSLQELSGVVAVAAAAEEE